MEEYVVAFEDDNEIVEFTSFEEAETYAKEILSESLTDDHEPLSATIYKKECTLQATVTTEVEIHYV